MSLPQDPQRPSFPFGNPFKMILPKGSYMSPKLLALLNTFEAALAERLRKLKPKDREDLLSLSWMRLAMESLCETHTDIKTVITKLELPICDWDEKWIDIYFDNSVRLLDICNAFSSELSRLRQGHLLLQYVLLNLESIPSRQSSRARSSIDSWRQLISSKNPRLDNCFTILDHLTKTLDSPKVKNSSKGKVLMQAMYGVKVHTWFICAIFSAALTGSAKKLMDLQVRETCLWAGAFADIQNCLHGEMRIISSSRRTSVVKELEAVDACVRKLHPLVQDGVDSVEVELQNSSFDLGQKADKLSQGLDLLTKGVDGFFQIILTGRNALLSNFRVGCKVSDPMQKINSVDFQVVR